jgi:hypothetical protein
MIHVLRNRQEHGATFDTDFLVEMKLSGQSPEDGEVHLRAQIRVQDVYGKYFHRNHVTNSRLTKRKLRYACFTHVFRTPLRIRKNTASSFYVKSTQFPLEFFGCTYLKYSNLRHFPKFVVSFPLHIQFHRF